MARSTRTPLTPARVIDEALALVNAEGLEALTLRSLAARLGVQNPALYWHVANKQALIDGMAHRIIDRMVAHAPSPKLRWDRWLTGLALAFREALLGTRDGARVIASADLSAERRIGRLEDAIARLVAAGFDRDDARIGVIAVFDYTLGASFEEQADPGVSGGERKRARLDTFRGGLGLLIAGLQTRL